MAIPFDELARLEAEVLDAALEYYKSDWNRREWTAVTLRVAANNYGTAMERARLLKADTIPAPPPDVDEEITCDARGAGGVGR